MSAKAINTLLAAAFDGEVPARIASLIQPDIAGSLLEDFKVGPVLPCGLGGRPTRVAISDQGEAIAWAAAVQRAWPHVLTDEWLRLGQGRRRMVDTAGGRKAVLYLDDLQDHPALERANAMRAPEDQAEVMCISVKLPSGTTSCVTRHTEPPMRHLFGGLSEAVADVVDQGAEGLWGLRWQGGRVVSVVWVTEARWRGTVARSTAIAESLAPPTSWGRCRSAMAAIGHTAYPDAVELFGDGTADLTVGVLASAVP